MALCYDLDLERRQLSQMTREQLEDVGLDHYSANQEARRNFFDIPPQRYGKSDKGTNHIRRNNRFVIFSLTGVLISVALLLVFGYVITLSVAAGFAGGFLVLWISRALRKYPTHHFDERETD